MPGNPAFLNNHEDYQVNDFDGACLCFVFVFRMFYVFIVPIEAQIVMMFCICGRWLGICNYKGTISKSAVCLKVRERQNITAFWVLSTLKCVCQVYTCTYKYVRRVCLIYKWYKYSYTCQLTLYIDARFVCHRNITTKVPLMCKHLLKTVKFSKTVITSCLRAKVTFISHFNRQ